MNTFIETSLRRLRRQERHATYATAASLAGVILLGHMSQESFQNQDIIKASIEAIGAVASGVLAIPFSAQADEFQARAVAVEAEHAI